MSDACNARLVAPPQHVVDLLAAAARHQPIADFYTGGFNDPDRFWHIVSRQDRTELITRLLIGGTIPAKPLEWDTITALADAGAVV